MKKLVPWILMAMAGWCLFAQDFVLDETCLDCHDDILAFTAHTPHQASQKVNCQDCHGSLETHVDDPTVENAVFPQGASGQKVCLNCHASQKHLAIPAGNMHASAGVYCTDCHKGHPTPSDGLQAPPNRVLTRAPSTELCGDCHTEQKLMQHKPFTHKLGRGGMECVSCHDPHGGSGRKSLKSAQSGELVCLDCHAEKKGPFIFEHVSGTAGDCLDCHEHHGSSNPKQLARARVFQLCIECHSTSIPTPNLGSQPPSFHDIREPRYQNCTVCHTAIHGSNRSPRLLK